MLVSLFAVSNVVFGNDHPLLDFEVSYEEHKEEYENANIFSFDKNDALAFSTLVTGFVVPTALSFCGNALTESIESKYLTTPINTIKEYPIASALLVFIGVSTFTAYSILKEIFQKSHNDNFKQSDKYKNFSDALTDKQLLATFTNFITYYSINCLTLGALVSVTNFALWKIRKG